MHALAQKVVEAFARASLSKIFVTHGDNIDRVKFDRYVEGVSAMAGRLPQDNLQGGPRVCSKPVVCGLVRKFVVDKPTRDEERGHKRRTKKNGKQAI